MQYCNNNSEGGDCSRVGRNAVLMTLEWFFRLKLLFWYLNPKMLLYLATVKRLLWTSTKLHNMRTVWCSTQKTPSSSYQVPETALFPFPQVLQVTAQLRNVITTSLSKEIDPTSVKFYWNRILQWSLNKQNESKEQQSATISNRKASAWSPSHSSRRPLHLPAHLPLSSLPWLRDERRWNGERGNIYMFPLSTLIQLKSSSSFPMDWIWALD